MYQPEICFLLVALELHIKLLLSIAHLDMDYIHVYLPLSKVYVEAASCCLCVQYIASDPPYLSLAAYIRCQNAVFHRLEIKYIIIPEFIAWCLCNQPMHSHVFSGSGLYVLGGVTALYG